MEGIYRLMNILAVDFNHGPANPFKRFHPDINSKYLGSIIKGALEEKKVKANPQPLPVQVTRPVSASPVAAAVAPAQYAETPAPTYNPATYYRPTSRRRRRSYTPSLPTPTGSVTAWMNSYFPRSTCKVCKGEVLKGQRIGKVNDIWMCESCATKA